MANPTVTVPAPARERRRGGFLSVIPVVDVPRLPAAETVVWPPNPCGVTQPAIGLCWGVPIEEEKEFDQLSDWGVASGSSLSGYYGVECFLDNYDYAAEARRGLEDSEDAYLEHAVQELVFDTATAETIDGADSLLEAIALAEDFADTRHRGPAEDGTGYIARPIIWMNRGDVVRAAAAFAIFGDRDGNLWTANGTPVIASGEFAPGAIWVSGFATLYRSPITDISTINPTTNREMAVAERVYGLGFDCLEPVYVPVESDTP